MTPKDEAQIDDLLTSLWERGLPVLRERLNLLDRAGMAAKAGDMNEALRVEAVGIAHKLAGSLGMFGYDRGTDISRQIEQMLAVPQDASGRLAALVSELRETLRIQ